MSVNHGLNLEISFLEKNVLSGKSSVNLKEGEARY